MTKKKWKVINLNYPPADMSQKELAELWGEPTAEDIKKMEEATRKAREAMVGRTRESYGY